MVSATVCIFQHLVDMNFSVCHYIRFAVIFLVSVRNIQGNDPFQGNFPTLKCQKARVITGCNGTLVDAYEQSNYSKSDENINRADTFVFLYTRRNKKCPEFLHRCDGRLPSNTNFRPEKRTIIVVGGYISAVCDLAYFRELKDQFLFRDDYNVILIDWPWGFYPDIYSSFVNAKVVGKQIAFLMIRIMGQTGVKGLNFYIVGHSIGAHIAGYAGRHFILFTGGEKIGRITGLDPASAVYSISGEDDILDKSDAVLVDIIHTNAGKCFPKAIGIYKATGHADFFVNGGTHQPSCIPNIFYSFLKHDYLKAVASLYPALCDHFQSIEFFKVSINACRCQIIAVECTIEEFKAGKCKSCGANGTRCALMGMDWEYCPRNSAPTVYYLHTAIQCPYCDKKRVNLQGYHCEELETNRCFSANTEPSNEICTKDY